MPLDAMLLDGLPPPPVFIDRGGDERPRREVPLIAPCIRLCERQTTEVWRGMFTIRYEFMSLWDFSFVTVTDKDNLDAVNRLREMGYPLIRSAKVGTETYNEWLRLYHRAGDILPHIQWGGVVKSIPGGDGGAGYRAWQLYALTLT